MLNALIKAQGKLLPKI